MEPDSVEFKAIIKALLPSWAQEMEPYSVDLEALLKALPGSGDPCTRFWIMIIALAIQDRATEVRYEPWRKKGVLCYTIQGKVFEMVPPPGHLALGLVRAIHQLSQPRQAETWRVRLARTLRQWADRLDPPPYYSQFEFSLNLKGGMSVAVRTSPSGDCEKWIGVVLRFCPDGEDAARTRASVAEWFAKMASSESG